MKNLTVNAEISINASVEQVWEVLTNPAFIKQWDDIPEGYAGGHLQLNTVIEWEGYSKLTVIAFEEKRLLQLSLFLPRVNQAPSTYNISYKYLLTERSGRARLAIEIGDFSGLPDAQKYYDSTIEFVQVAKEKIKAFAEERN